MAESSSGNPAVLFLGTPRHVSPDELVQAYATFLLQESAAYQLPIQLARVQARFKLPVHRRQLATDQRGFTTSDLRIYLNASDWPSVQKFTLAHEFLEVLFFALKDGHADHWMSDALFESLCNSKEKERFCDKGAAELVLPMPLFQPLASQAPLTLARAQEIAAYCGVSLTATLWRIIEAGIAPVVLIFWRFKHSPTEFVPSRVGQGNLFGPPEDMDPPKKMRVERVISAPGAPFIPSDKSAPVESSIHRAFVDDVPTLGYDSLDLVGICGRYFVESRPFYVNGERGVMSLIHLDQC